MNIETDILGKYVEKLFPRARTKGENDAPKSAGGLTLDFLREQGF